MFDQSTIVFTVSPSGVIGRDLSGGHPVSRTCSALTHPRTLMGSFDEIAACFRAMLQELASGGLFRPPPRLVIQLPPGAEGGYTDVEHRAFVEAALQAGVRNVRTTESRETLSEDDVDRLFRAKDRPMPGPAP